MPTAQRPIDFKLTAEQQARLQQQREQIAAERPQPAAAGWNEFTRPSKSRRFVASSAKRFTAAGG